MAKILIIEDDPGIALGVKNDLLLEGHEAEVARDGLAGLERARGGEFDLILLDIMLPKKDGYAVCRELRHAGDRTPILMLTAKALEAEKVLGLELGADDYVTKPFSALELRARVKAMLRRGAPEAPEIFRFGDVEVDFGRGEVRRGGAPIETTPLEFKLLSAFLVWRPDSFPTDRVIDNHIMNLRRKIEPEPETPRHLVSVRGLGYRFDA
jgi:DNA-binding response OmpR family regulator